MRGKNLSENIIKTLMLLSLVTIFAVLLYIIYIIFSEGLPALTWEMISSKPKSGYYYGKEGGILNAIIGSLYLSFGSVCLALVFGLPIALMMNVYISRQKKLVETMRLLLDLLWGIPSIVYGAFGFLFMVWLGMRSSLGGAIITVAIFILPIMIRSMDEVLKTVPKGLAESGYALGASKRIMAFVIYTRQAFPGIVTAILLSFGRAIGDAAAVLFTAGYTDSIPDSLSSPAATLPLAVYFQLSSPIPEVKQRAYAAALVLTLIILFISLTSRYLSIKISKNQIRH